MTKLIIALLVVSLIGVVTPQIYYRVNLVQPAPFVAIHHVTEESKVVHKKVKTKKKVASSSTSIKPTLTVETKIYIDEIFGKDAKIATATFMHESGLVLDKQGYNCHYYNKDGIRYSTSCKTIEDRANAWSVDCGLTQINVKGKVCPSELFTLEGNMAEAKKKYKTQGLKAWASYTSGRYKKFL